MLDINFIKNNVDAIKDIAKNKNISIDIDNLLEINKERVSLLRQIENLLAEKNKINEAIQKSSSDERKNLIENGKIIKEKLSEIEPAYIEINKKYDEIMVKIPNIVSKDTPIGKSEHDNIEIGIFGKIPSFDFKPKDHIQIGVDLDILDLERGSKVGGYRGYYLKNEGVSLVMAMMLFALNKMIEKGFTPFIPPTLVKGSALFGSGYFKNLEYDPEIDEVYQISSNDKEIDGKTNKEKKFLVGTAEPSLLAYYSNETLKEEDLPIKMCGYSQCYRSEIGSYGKDTRGFYRVHEFMKIEQVVLTSANIEESIKIHDSMLEISKEIHDDLNIAYRVLQICSGDMSAGKYRAFDIEAWLPGLDRWGETGSASNFLDWQARRLNVKYIDKSGEKKYVYMLNNTALASPRPFIAILENYQQKDGSVIVPEVLRKYMPGKKEIIAPKR